MVVKDLEKVLGIYRSLGMAAGEPVFYPEVAMNIAFIGEGSARIELVASNGETGPVYGHPGGLHHIALATRDIEGLYRRLSTDNNFLVEGEIRQGAHNRIFFFRIAGEEETLYECVEEVNE